MDTVSPTAAPVRRTWFHPYRLGQRLALYVGLIYLGIMGILFYQQTTLIYPGSTDEVRADQVALFLKHSNLIIWDQPTAGASSPQGFVRSDFAQPAPRGTIVFFHGNGEHAYLCGSQVAGMTSRGFRVFLYEYPGYSGRPGIPSEKTIVPDAQALVGSLAKAGYGPIYLWGHSLGSGVAAAVCADKSLPIQGVVLSSPFDSIRNAAAGFYPWLPVRYLMHDNYDSMANLHDFGHPICVIRGDRDGVVLPVRTLNLFAHLPDPKKIILMSGYGHGNWSYDNGEKWWDEALDFIAPR